MVIAVSFLLVAGVASVVRFALGGFVPAPVGFPLGTLAVNLVGAFWLGLIASWDAPAATVAGTAGLGALTTFSTLSSEAVAVWSERRTVAVAYLAITIVGGVALASIGLRLGR